jgi:hypothetical protein
MQIGTHIRSLSAPVPVRLACLVACSVVLAGDALAGPGETGLAFLRVGVGTDAAGMGNAYTSQVSDATATYWNPAGLARMNGTDVFLMHNEFIADLRLEYAAVARTFGRHGVGLSFNGLFTSDLEGRDENGEITGDVGYNDLALTLGYAYMLSDALSVGLNGKLLREFIGDPAATEDHVASGFAVDVGAQYHTERLLFGVAAQNLGSDLSFNEVQIVSQSGPGSVVGGEAFSLPVSLQGGVTFRPGWNVLEGGVEVALEARQVNDGTFSTHMGARYAYRDLAALSVGYRSGLDTEDVSFGLQLTRERLRVGYAFVPFSDDLGNSHRLSLGYHLP